MRQSRLSSSETFIFYGSDLLYVLVYLSFRFKTDIFCSRCPFSSPFSGKIFTSVRRGASVAVINRSSYRRGLIINNIITFTFNTLRHPQSVSVRLTQTKMELFCKSFDVINLDTFYVYFEGLKHPIDRFFMSCKLSVDNNNYSSFIFGKPDFAM